MRSSRVSEHLHAPDKYSIQLLSAEKGRVRGVSASSYVPKEPPVSLAPVPFSSWSGAMQKKMQVLANLTFSTSDYQNWPINLWYWGLLTPRISTEL